MNKNIIISVKGKQISGNEEPNIFELITEGKYYKDEEGYCVTYDESEVTGMEGTTTTIKVADGIVTLMRIGSINSQFVFQKGRKHISYYDTSYGAFTVGIFAKEVNIDMDDYGGEISIDYHIEIGNNKAGNNDFYMSIREAGCLDDKCS